MSLPHAREPIAGALPVSAAWRSWFQRLEAALSAAGSSADTIAGMVHALAVKLGSPDGSIDGIPAPGGDDFILYGTGSVSVFGTPASGRVEVTLRGDGTRPGATFVYGTDGDGELGWQALADGFVASDSVVPTAGADGRVEFALADLADTGAGTLLAIERDGKGRVAGSRAATTDDLPEGVVNLYLTDARIDARIAAQKGAPGGLATLDENAHLTDGQQPEIIDGGNF